MRIEFAGEKFGKQIVDIKDDGLSLPLRRQRSKHKEVGNVMDMDNVVRMVALVEVQAPSCAKKKARYSIDVSEESLFVYHTALDSENIDAVTDLERGEGFVAPQCNDIDAISSLRQSSGILENARIALIKRIGHHADPKLPA